eukprot:5585276-Amphidinium_carterae.1
MEPDEPANYYPVSGHYHHARIAKHQPKQRSVAYSQQGSIKLCNILGFSWRPRYGNTTYGMTCNQATDHPKQNDDISADCSLGKETL